MWAASLPTPVPALVGPRAPPRSLGSAALPVPLLLGGLPVSAAAPARLPWDPLGGGGGPNGPFRGWARPALAPPCPAGLSWPWDPGCTGPLPRTHLRPLGWKQPSGFCLLDKRPAFSRLRLCSAPAADLRVTPPSASHLPSLSRCRLCLCCYWCFA